MEQSDNETTQLQRRLNDPEVNAALVRIVERINELEETLDSVTSLAKKLPAMTATFTDVADDTYSQLQAAGIDLEQRTRQALTLVEQLTAPKTTAALTQIISRIDELSRLVELSAELPGLLSTVTDIIDDEYRKAADNGVDLQQSISNGVKAALRFGDRVSMAQIDRLIDLLNSDVLHPSAIDVVGSASKALIESEQTKPTKVGFFGLLRQFWNPNFRNTLGFFVQFANRFGADLEKKTNENTNDNRSSQ